MVFQQFVGINGIGFYASETFAEAGNKNKPHNSSFHADFFFFSAKHIHFLSHQTAGFSSSKVGTIAYACVQVLNLPLMSSKTSKHFWLLTFEYYLTGPNNCGWSNFDGQIRKKTSYNGKYPNQTFQIYFENPTKDEPFVII